MLKRSKSNRSQRANRRSGAGKSSLQQQKLESLEDNNRHSDGDSSQSSITTPAVFASVHRTRHAGLKRNDAGTTNNGTTAAIVHTQGNSTALNGVGGNMRPTYQQYQQQRRMQFQQQQQQKQQQQPMQLQQPYYTVNIANLPKSKATNAGCSTTNGLHVVGGGGGGGVGVGSGVLSYDIQHQQMPAVNQTNQHFMQAPNHGLNSGQLQQQPHIHAQQTKSSLNSQAMSRIPIQHQKMQHLQQQQQQQQQHHQPVSTFNHISKNATNLLNDIYERNLLSHTTFVESDQQQQQQQQLLLQQQQFLLHQRNSGRPQIPLPQTNNAPNWSQKSTLKSFNKIIAPPTSGASYQQHFQFSDSYVEPVDTKKHFLIESQPPPPPAPLNHVYETIRERPPMPPPPPERNQAAPPPLPPSRLLKKKLMASHGVGQGGVASATNGGCGTSGRTHKSHKKSSHDKELDKKAAAHASKLTHNQPPAYVAPPPLLAPNGPNAKMTATPAGYNPQQRTKADGEHKSMLYQQLREQKIQHHQQQQQQQHKLMQPLAENGASVNGAGNVQHLNNNLPKQGSSSASSTPSQFCKMGGNAMREHPLGAHDENTPMAPHTNTATTTNHNVSSNCNNNTTTSEDIVTLEDHDQELMQQLSVEQTLQQAGLLPTNSGTSNTPAVPPSAVQNNNGRNNRPSALPIVFEEDTGEFQDVLVLEQDGTAKLPYRHGKKIEVRLETAQAMAAAAYYASYINKMNTIVVDTYYGLLRLSIDNYSHRTYYDEVIDILIEECGVILVKKLYSYTFPPFVPYKSIIILIP
ncbi:uncharacterized protein LOC142225272 [Haematobia irritans]|uniref:uncharacterized protein LOC142225272 n=1 Tax=Haematobia irritans TaxID=7368 RepID=UPI003F501CB3